MLGKVLKERTSPAHARVDRLFGRLDIAQEVDLGHFLTAHVLAMESLSRGLSDPLPFVDLTRLIGLAQRDLSRLGRLADRRRRPPSPILASPLGVAYVIAGSRLGAAVLRREWERSNSPRVLAAREFLCDRESLAEWRRVSAHLATSEFAQEETESAVESALAVFACFEVAYRAAEPVHLTRPQDGHDAALRP